MSAVVGDFPDRHSALRGINHLLLNGIARRQLGVLWCDEVLSRSHEMVIEYGHRGDIVAEIGKGTAGGIAGGAVAGAGAALLASAENALIPLGIDAFLPTGPVLAAITAIVVGAVFGGAAGSVIGALTGAANLEATELEEAGEDYLRHLEHDGYLIIVETDDDLLPETVDLLKDVGADDVTTLHLQEAILS